MNEKYKKIINLPHKQSLRRPHMSRIDRAAQFAPFAALTGYDDVIEEVGRLTDEEVHVSEDMQGQLNVRLQILVEKIDEKNEVCITYFEPDEIKSGGTYIKKQGYVKKFYEYEKLLVLNDGTKIPIDRICAIDGDIFLRQ